MATQDVTIFNEDGNRSADVDRILQGNSLAVDPRDDENYVRRGWGFAAWSVGLALPAVNSLSITSGQKTIKIEKIFVSPINGPLTVIIYNNATVSNGTVVSARNRLGGNNTTSTATIRVNPTAIVPFGSEIFNGKTGYDYYGGCWVLDVKHGIQLQPNKSLVIKISPTTGADQTIGIWWVEQEED